MIKSILPATFDGLGIANPAYAGGQPGECNKPYPSRRKKNITKAISNTIRPRRNTIRPKRNTIRNTITVANIGATVIPTAHAAQSGALQPVRFGTAHSA